jgi:hypothetical protein
MRYDSLCRSSDLEVVCILLKRLETVGGRRADLSEVGRVHP